jgi:hypothetical protein
MRGTTVLSVNDDETWALLTEASVELGFQEFVRVAEINDVVSALRDEQAVDNRYLPQNRARQLRF